MHNLAYKLPKSAALSVSVRKPSFLPSQSEIAEGYVSIAVYLFIYLFIYLFMFVYALYSPINSKSIQPNRMTFGEMIGYYPHQ